MAGETGIPTRQHPFHSNKGDGLINISQEDAGLK
jgi:hypothetical protein